ncbi:hypothetical protein [Culicoidibacter larvae]|uniref:Uncharacterized protein n=1 Tax=Culicoidibacter larvae TaxID=2579976 RepID=A0A5R8QGI1_9FIRM|nr:hypothetical protein [Culicoidibacter larvae]TLG76563.1 hypothetical protein FEZ08_02800 [Culicoidibacter larvae]
METCAGKNWATDGKVNSALWSNETVLDELHFWQQIPNQNLEYYYAQLRIAFIAKELGELEIAKQLIDAIPDEGRTYISEEYEYSFEKIDVLLTEKFAERKRPNTIPSGVFFDNKDSIWVLGTKNDLHAYVGEVTEWNQSGELTEKAFYSGDEGDTVIFKTYNQAGEVWSDGTWVDGLMIENNVYRCEHSNHLLDTYGVEDVHAAKIMATEIALLNQSIAFTIYDEHNREIGKIDYRDDNNFAEGFFEDTTRNLLKAYSPIVRGTYGLIRGRLANVERAELASETLQTLYDCLAFIADHVVDNDVVIDEDFIAMHNMLDNSQFKSFNVNFESFIKAQASNYLAMIVDQVK